MDTLASIWLRLGGVAVLTAAFLRAYQSTFQKLGEYWTANDMYSYGFVVPIISGYLIWLRRRTLQSIPISPSYVLGTAALAGALAMLVAGRVSNTNLVEELSLPFAVGGVTLLVLGRRMTESMAFPLAYLFVMIPFWDFFTARLHAPFQLYSAVVGVAAMRLFDVPVLREGVLIYLPNITLEVAEVCSGVNQLVAILCIGVPLAHISMRSWSKRAVIVFAALVIALLSNGVRVALISLLAYHDLRGPDGDVHGPYSLLRTTIISAVGYLILFWLIARFADPPAERPYAKRADAERADPELADAAPPDVTAARAEPAARKTLRGPAVVLATALLAAVIAFEQWHDVARVPLAASFTDFPTSIGRWQMLGGETVSAPVEAIKFDHALSRRYAAPDGTELNLVVGYFERQQQGRELVGFELSRALAASSGPFTRRLGNNIRVKDFLTTVDAHPYHVTYWYVLDGRMAAENYEAKLLATWNALALHRSNGAIILVRTKLRQDESIDVSRSRVRDFVEGVIVASGPYFPS